MFTGTGSFFGLWRTLVLSVTPGIIEHVFDSLFSTHESNQPAVIGSVAAADPTALTDGQLRDGLAAFEQLTSFAQAGQFALMAEMAWRQDTTAAAGSTDTPSAMEDPYRFLVDEVAVELRLSKLAASFRFHLALDLVAFPDTLAALRDGRVDRKSVV